MSDNTLFPVPDAVAASAHINNDQYLEMYKRSVEDNEGFWGEHGKRIDWIKLDQALYQGQGRQFQRARRFH